MKFAVGEAFMVQGTRYRVTELWLGHCRKHQCPYYRAVDVYSNMRVRFCESVMIKVPQ